MEGSRSINEITRNRLLHKDIGIARHHIRFLAVCSGFKNPNFLNDCKTRGKNRTASSVFEMQCIADDNKIE